MGAFFRKDKSRLKKVITNAKKARFSKPSYFSLIFEDLTDEDKIVEMTNTTCYQFFIEAVGGFDADVIYELGDDRVFGAFGLTASKRKKNVGKKTNSVAQMTSSSRNKILKADSIVLETFFKQKGY
jgi:hypothetical protein